MGILSQVGKSKVGKILEMMAEDEYRTKVAAGSKRDSQYKKASP
jgi:hypothetical protein